ncbi:MAG: hypothetical protein KIS68_10800 [Bauldia sp.]|nr:hypothetical protein [Bauldia sp.]
MARALAPRNARWRMTGLPVQAVLGSGGEPPMTAEHRNAILRKVVSRAVAG